MFEMKRVRNVHLPPVRLTVDERRVVVREARRRGLTLSDLAREAIKAYLKQDAHNKPITEVKLCQT